MKNFAYLLIFMVIIFFSYQCSNTSHNHDHSHDRHSHSHELEKHNHDDQDHDHEGHNHEGHDHDHGHEEHNHEGHDHDEDYEGHNHEGHDHDEEGCQHDDEYGLMEIVAQEYNEIIHTSGKILPAQGDEVTLTAIHNGIVVFEKKSLMPGNKVSARESLLTISGEELVHDNIETTFRDAKSLYETALANFERAKLLNKDKIISDRDFATVGLEYEKAKNNFEQVKRNYISGGQRIPASIDGYIKNIFVSEGQYVTTGQALLKITKNKRLVVKADVPQQYFPMLKSIKSANFKTIYDSRIYNTDNLNGTLLSYGKTTLENSLFTPIFFEIDNIGELLSGSYIEIFLKTAPVADCIIIPKSALLEEAGRFYVYAEENHEFEKRYVTIDCNDGLNYHIIDGLTEGDRIATHNPYMIKLSTLSSALPAHSHNH